MDFSFILQEQDIIDFVQLQNTFSKQFLTIFLNLGEVIITDNYIEGNQKSIKSFRNNMVFIYNFCWGFYFIIGADYMFRSTLEH